MSQETNLQLTPSEIEAEERDARRAGGLGLLAGFLMIGGMAIVASANPGKVLDQRERLQHADENASSLIAAHSLFALSFLLMAPVLVFVYRAIRARNAAIPPIARGLAIAGPLLVGLVGIAYQVALVSLAGDFVDDPVRTLAAAKDKVDTDLLNGLEFASIPGTLMFGFALLMLSLNAMRAGLFTKGQGFAGVALAVLVAIFLAVIGPVPLMLALWFGWISVTLMSAGERRPPAWREGRAITWPDAGELRRQAAEDAEAAAAGETDTSAPEQRSLDEPGTPGDAGSDSKA